ncbi:MAG: ATP-dependent DNA helicase [Oscillospiraceae bacterium]|nr:ATP-dependent DNA helicase [Oscillospiraceae bacterium]
MERITLAVRRIVEQVLRCGDIDSRFVDSSAMFEGAKAHRKLQKAMGGGYKSEVKLSLDTTAGDIPVKLTGRADGIITTPDGITIDEIKTTTLPLDILCKQSGMHYGQAKCYAYMWLRAQDAPPSEITVQLTYYQLETHETKRHRETYTAEELAVFMDKLLSDYAVWLSRERDWNVIRDTSIKALTFPFETYRKGQRELAVAAYRTIENGRKLYAQAPTGIGKTLSTLFPSIKAVGENEAGKIFYLTAKTVTREVAENAVALMLKKGLRFKSVTLRAKEKLCFCEETICTPDYCPYAKGHFDRINNALMSLLEGNDLITPAAVEETARLHRVCPYELSLDAALWADAIICDYNHIFDPVVYLRRFFSDIGADSDYVFLIDEAHNLDGRVREMYSAELHKNLYYRLQKALKDKTPHAKELRRAAKKINAYLFDVRKELIAEDTDSRVTDTLDSALTELAVDFSAAAGEWLKAESGGVHPAQDDVLALYFETLTYLGIAECFNERYCAITEIFESDVKVTLFCIDPSEIIAERLKFAKATVMFSATLTPLTYYRDILGGNYNDALLTLPSPYDSTKLALTAHCGISTKYAARKDSYIPLANAIHTAISKKRGNYIIYFPSYDYMRQVYEPFTELCPDINTVIQDSGMDEENRAAFLRRFDADNQETLIGFCVLGGIFSEGIDLTGERLIGTVIVGVGLPKLSLRQEIIRKYFDRTIGAGYDYAYVFPGFNKVLQAAGRVIRSESDSGSVLLIDTRYSTRQYKSLFPAHWSHMRYIDRL